MHPGFAPGGRIPVEPGVTASGIRPDAPSGPNAVGRRIGNVNRSGTSIMLNVNRTRQPAGDRLE